MSRPAHSPVPPTHSCCQCAEAACGADGCTGERPIHWVEEDVQSALNAAHSEAELYGASSVELFHLLIVLARSAVARDLLAKGGIDARVLEAVTRLEAATAERAPAKPRTGRDVRQLLAVANRAAAIHGDGIISLRHLIASLVAVPQSLAAAEHLARWFWAARRAPSSRVETTAHDSRGNDVSALFGSWQQHSVAAPKPAAAVAAPEPSPPIVIPSMVDAKIISLKSRADVEELADEVVDDPNLEPDPELEKLGVKRYYLSLDDEIVRAPSIGPKTAARLEPHGLTHVKHLLACDPERLSARLGARHLTASRIAAWKNQARLVCSIPWLRGTHAQLLVGAGFASIEKILSTDRTQVCAAVLHYASTRDGQAILRGAAPPDLERIMRWIENSQQAEPQRAQWGKVLNS
ncbi:MAG: hypothetical protein RL291_1552 [Pseudomonadota bacterium]